MRIVAWYVFPCVLFVYAGMCLVKCAMLHALCFFGVFCLCVCGCVWLKPHCCMVCVFVSVCFVCVYVGVCVWLNAHCCMVCFFLCFVCV